MIGYTNWINGAAILGITGMLVMSHQPAETAPGAPGTRGEQTIDKIITASTANHFMVVDHERSSTCVISLHRAEGYVIHRVEPGNCGSMPAHLQEARTWQERGQGTVHITDRKGKVLMKLGPSDGFAWEVYEPAGLQVSFEAY